MARALIGVDSTGAGCLKIMRDNAHDPRTTPDSERWKFAYNSKLSVQCQIVTVEQCNYSSGGPYYTPAGSESNYQRLVWSNSGSQDARHIFRKSYFPALRYDYPIYDVKWINKDSGRFTQGNVSLERPGGYGNFGGVFATGMRKELGWADWTAQDYGGTIGLAVQVQTDYSNASGNLSIDKNHYKRLVVWNLPGDNAALVDAPAQSPLSGQMAVQITQNYCRIAKPGYDVRSASALQLAYDSTNRPAKVIAAADIEIPSGDSQYDCGFPLPQNVVADVHFYTGGAIYYRPIPAIWPLAPTIGFLAARSTLLIRMGRVGALPDYRRR